MAFVELKEICKRYKGSKQLAVDNVTLKIKDGEFMVLLGPSGCGKSTTLRMIAGLEKITSGTLSIDGRVMNKVPPKDRDIAMVFQSYALYPHMKVRENLAFGLRRRHIDRREIVKRVEEVADMLGLTELFDRKPHALSGGQRQRVALGRAIVRDPKVFLFDEPLSNLDAALRVGTRNELLKLHHRLGATIIYVTHDQIEAMSMGSRICIMNNGKVVQIGTALEVYRNPADTFVANFLGSPPVNLLPAVIQPLADKVAVKLAGHTFALPKYTPDRLADYKYSSVIFGIRPENLHVIPPPFSDRVNLGEIPAKIIAVSPLGSETLLILRFEGIEKEVIAKVSSETSAKIDDNIRIFIDLNAVHLYDANTTKAIHIR